jgi:hypothetical protein
MNYFSLVRYGGRWRYCSEEDGDGECRWRLQMAMGIGGDGDTVAEGI